MSTSTFDPYHKWLGIPVDRRPPTHYDLLGISPGEQDPEVIAGAAIRQSAFVRTFQSGQHAADASRILSELALARVVLNDPAKRANYDAGLKPAPPKLQPEPKLESESKPEPESTTPRSSESSPPSLPRPKPKSQSWADSKRPPARVELKLDPTAPLDANASAEPDDGAPARRPRRGPRIPSAALGALAGVITGMAIWLVDPFGWFGDPPRQADAQPAAAIADTQPNAEAAPAPAPSSSPSIESATESLAKLELKPQPEPVADSKPAASPAPPPKTSSKRETRPPQPQPTPKPNPQPPPPKLTTIAPDLRPAKFLQLRERDYVELPQTSKLTSEPDFTIEAWIRLDGVWDNSTKLTVLSNQSMPDRKPEGRTVRELSGWTLRVRQWGPQQLVMQFEAASKLSGGAPRWLALTSAPQPDRPGWQHAAVRVKAGDAVLLFWNGTPCGRVSLDKERLVAGVTDLDLGTPPHMRNLGERSQVVLSICRLRIRRDSDYESSFTPDWRWRSDDAATTLLLDFAQDGEAYVPDLTAKNRRAAIFGARWTAASGEPGDNLKIIKQHLAAAENQQKLKRTEKAIAEYDYAISLEPRLTEALTKRGLCYFAQTQYDLAGEDFRKALETLDDNGSNNRDRAWVLTYQGLNFYRQAQRDRAEQALDQAVQINNRNAMAYYLRGVVRKAQGKTKEGDKDLDQAHRIDAKVRLEAFRNWGLKPP